MRILFILTDIGSVPNIFTGIASIASNARVKGHEIKLIHINDDIGFGFDIGRVIEKTETYAPDIIAFSSSTVHAHLVMDLAVHIKKKYDIPIIYGGPHASVSPKKILESGVVDFVCIGEGERAFLEFLDRFENGDDIYSVMNIWSFKDGEILKNPLRPLVKNLSELEFPDYQIFNIDKILELRNGWFDIVNIRGCPYRCSYCQSPRISKMYREQKATTRGWYIQKWGVAEIMHHLELLLDKYPQIKLFNFVDDMFLVDKKYVKNFCKAFREAIFLPHGVGMNIHARLETIDQEILEVLEDSGTRIIKIGLETGNEQLRKKVLRKGFSNEAIKKTFDLIRARNFSMETWVFNMIGIPGETRETLQDTFDLLARIKPDNVWFSIYYPLPQTDLFDECVENNLIDEKKADQLTSYREESSLYLPGFMEDDIGKVYKIFNWYLNRALHPGDSFLKELVDHVESPDFHLHDLERVANYVEYGNTMIRSEYYDAQKEYFDPRWTYISLYNDWGDNTESKKLLKGYLKEKRRFLTKSTPVS